MASGLRRGFPPVEGWVRLPVLLQARERTLAACISVSFYLSSNSGRVREAANWRRGLGGRGRAPWALRELLFFWIFLKHDYLASAWSLVSQLIHGVSMMQISEHRKHSPWPQAVYDPSSMLLSKLGSHLGIPSEFPLDSLHPQCLTGILPNSRFQFLHMRDAPRRRLCGAWGQRPRFWSHHGGDPDGDCALLGALLRSRSPGPHFQVFAGQPSPYAAIQTDSWQAFLTATGAGSGARIDAHHGDGGAGTHVSMHMHVNVCLRSLRAPPSPSHP